MDKKLYLADMLPIEEKHTVSVPSSRIDDAIRQQYDIARAHAEDRRLAGDPRFQDTSKLTFKSFMPVAWQVMHDPNVLFRKDPKVVERAELLGPTNESVLPSAYPPIEEGERRIRSKQGVWFPVPESVRPPQGEVLLPIDNLFDYTVFLNWMHVPLISGLITTVIPLIALSMRRWIFDRNTMLIGMARPARRYHAFFRRLRASRRIVPWFFQKYFMRGFLAALPAPLFLAPQHVHSKFSAGVGAYAAYINLFIINKTLTLSHRCFRAALAFAAVGYVWSPVRRFSDELTALYHRQIMPFGGSDIPWARVARRYERARYRMTADQADDMRPDISRLARGRLHYTIRDMEYLATPWIGMMTRMGLGKDAMDWITVPISPRITAPKPDELLLRTWTFNHRRSDRYDLELADRTRGKNDRRLGNRMRLRLLPDPSAQKSRPLWRPTLLHTEADDIIRTASTPVDSRFWPSPLMPPSSKYFGIPTRPGVHMTKQVRELGRENAEREVAEAARRLGSVAGSQQEQIRGYFENMKAAPSLLSSVLRRDGSSPA